jgi:hypothetical protein
LWSEQAAAGAAAAKAANNLMTVVVVFMVLFDRYLTFEEREKAAAMTLGWWLQNKWAEQCLHFELHLQWKKRILFHYGN